MSGTWEPSRPFVSPEVADKSLSVSRSICTTQQAEQEPVPLDQLFEFDLPDVDLPQASTSTLKDDQTSCQGRPSSIVKSKPPPLELDSSDDDDNQPLMKIKNTSKHFTPASIPFEGSSTRDKGKQKAVESEQPPIPYSKQDRQKILNEHPWSPEVFKILHQIFKCPGFRRNQLEAINATLSGKDVFVLMPTGGGKSICYQLPAVVKSGKTMGISIVVSPLLSLIQDQVNALAKKGIAALPFNSQQTQQERDFILSDMKREKPNLALIYVTPELVSLSFPCILNSS